jgi:tetratricopeptide (TPR) repeat protein
LLLAFEHRNYFPSVGLLLATFSLIIIDGKVRQTRIRVALIAVAACFYAFTTWMRANEWSDPDRLAMSEASKRPDSPIAQFERAKILLRSRNLNGTSLAEDGFLALEDASRLPEASISFEQILITMHAEAGQPANSTWMSSIVQKLRSRPATPTDARALANLNACFIDQRCKDGLNELGLAYTAALSHPNPSAALLSVHAEYSWYLRNDRDTAERDIRGSVKASPMDLEARKNLIVLLIALKKYPEAETELGKLQEINFAGMFNAYIAPLREALIVAERSANTNNGQ